MLNKLVQAAGMILSLSRGEYVDIDINLQKGRVLNEETTNLLISFITIIIAKTYKISIIHYIILGYGLMRVFEIFVYQVNVLLFDEYRAVVKKDQEPEDVEKDVDKQNNKNKNSYAVKSYRRMIVLLLHNFTEIIFWFAASYAILSNEFSFNIKQATIIEIIYTSFIKLTNFGSVSLDYKTPLGMRIIWFQSIVGMFMTVVVIARFIGLLPAPNSKDKNET